MAGKSKDPKPGGEEVGVIPMPDSKSAGTWWVVFGACVLMTMWTRLHKVNRNCKIVYSMIDFFLILCVLQ